MDIPAPVDLSALQGLLAKSKQVMNKVEEKKPIKQTQSINETYESSDSYYSSENDEKNMMYEGYTPPSHDPTKVSDYTDEQVINSNLPSAIKEAMLKNRIPKLSGPPSKFTAEELSKITGAPLKQNKQPINEYQQRPTSDMITVSKVQLQEMIDEGISRFFKQVYDKTLTEETIKKTINLLIKEGKITVKKKQL